MASVKNLRIERMQKACEIIGAISEAIDIAKTAYDNYKEQNKPNAPVTHHYTEKYTTVFPLPSLSTIDSSPSFLQPQSQFQSQSLTQPLPLSQPLPKSQSQSQSQSLAQPQPLPTLHPVNTMQSHTTNSNMQMVANMESQALQRNINEGLYSTKLEQRWNYTQSLIRQGEAACYGNNH
jgi:hypothetical protein